MREITYLEAIREALREEMRRDERVFLMGEDIGVFGGAWRVTEGLLKEFGPERVRDTPISETAIVGAGVGAAINGLKPVVEIMYMDFLTVAMDQLVNHAAKIHFMTAGQLRVPLVVRTQSSLGRYSGAQHAQYFPSIFMQVPGWKLAVPSTPRDAKGLLKMAIRDENPVMFLEFSTLYPTRGPVPEEEYLVPFGSADVKREGGDVTIVAVQSLVPQALRAAEELSKQGVEAEVVDPRTLVPLDRATIIGSVKKTGRAVIAEASCRSAGVGAELSALIVEEAFDYLDAPVVRVSAPDTPAPFSPVLQDEHYIPNSQKILEAVRKSLS